jgi:hypothetical protein
MCPNWNVATDEGQDSTAGNWSACAEGCVQAYLKAYPTCTTWVWDSTLGPQNNCRFFSTMSANPGKEKMAL